MQMGNIYQKSCTIQKLAKYCLISFFLSWSALADTAVALRKDQIAPFDGILITKELSKEFRQKEKDNIALKEQKVTLKELSEVLRQQKELWKDESKINFKNYKKEQIKGNFRGILGFVLGIVATGVGVFAGAKIIKGAK